MTELKEKKLQDTIQLLEAKIEELEIEASTAQKYVQIFKTRHSVSIKMIVLNCLCVHVTEDRLTLKNTVSSTNVLRRCRGDTTSFVVCCWATR